VLAETSLDALSRPSIDAAPNQGLLWMLLRGDDGKSVEGVYHTGWLGQWIVVLPQSKTVAVRLRRWKDERDAERPEYQFGGFAARVMDAAK
jgi:CubicO group peptidase (beta-lactamase class C family)